MNPFAGNGFALRKETLVLNVRLPPMSDQSFSTAKIQAGAERRLIRVRAPAAHAGIGLALRQAFAAPPLPDSNCEFMRLLERV